MPRRAEMSMGCASDELITGLGAALSVFMSILETCRLPAGKMVLIPGTHEFYLLAFAYVCKILAYIFNTESVVLIPLMSTAHPA